MSHCEAIASTGKETLCKQLGGKITRLRASKKELEAEVRQLTAERDRYKAALEEIMARHTLDAAPLHYIAKKALSQEAK